MRLLVVFVIYAVFSVLRAENNVTVNDPVLSVKEGNVCSVFADAAYERGFDDGYSYGYASGDYDVKRFLSKYGKLLDEAFPIGRFYIEGVLRPPVVKERKDDASVTKDGTSYIRKKKIYEIVSPAKFVERPPTWRDFLAYSDPKKPSKPKRDSGVPERYAKECADEANARYDEGFEKGFSVGYGEAMRLYARRASRLREFIESLSLYESLVYRRILNPPVISKVSAGVARNSGGDTLVIGEVGYKIVERAKFIDNPRIWKVIVDKKTGKRKRNIIDDKE